MNYTVEFDRLGRTHHPPPLDAASDQPPGPALADEIATAVTRYARQYCGSHDLSAAVYDDWTGTVYAGARPAGTFRIPGLQPAPEEHL